MSRKRNVALRGGIVLGAAGMLMLASPMVHAQLSGPPAGVPVPPVTTPTDAQIVPADPAATSTAVFRVRVLDGRNGTPLENAHVRLWYDDAGTAGYLLATPPNGTAQMPEPVGMPIRVLLSTLDRIDCRKLPLNEPAPGYNLQQIAQKGIVLQNTCGPVSAKARPGELVLFARPLRWYETINRP